MRDSDTGLIELADIPRAIGFLTRLPLRVDGDAAVARGAGCVWAYPIAGLVVGTVVAAILWALMAVGVPAALTAGGAVAAGLFVTGALHEDGMADTVDGLWGGWTRERRLEIMKDSRIGAYGVLALVVTVGLRWQGFAAIDALWAVVAVAAASRAAMVPLMRMDNARGSGVSASVGRPSLGAVWLALSLGALPLLALGGAGIAALVAIAAAAAAMAMLARAKIGGQTGDILGATQQISEIAALVVLVALGV